MRGRRREYYEYSTGYTRHGRARNPLFIPAATSARARGFRAKIEPTAEDE